MVRTHHEHVPEEKILFIHPITFKLHEDYSLVITVTIPKKLQGHCPLTKRCITFLFL